MKIIGVELRKPSFTEVTAAAVLACGLWLAWLGIARSIGHAVERADAGAMLLVIFWGCVCVRLGIRVDRGVRHLALNLVCCGLIVGLYQAALALLG